MQAVRLRYLNAMGIDSWVRRAEVPGAAVAVGVDDGETVVEQLSDEPVTAVRHLLDPEAASEPAAAAAQSVELAQAADAQATPEFRLLLLHLAGSVLLIDESLLDAGSLKHEQVLLLGDVLRTARLLVHGDAQGGVEQQIFFWPQINDATLDQGPHRAREALSYHLQMRLEGGSGPIIHVAAPENAATGAVTSIVRHSVRSHGVPRLEVASELLDLQASAQVRARVWADLRQLGGSA